METRRQIMFKRENLRSFKQVSAPGNKVELEVASNVTEGNRINATDPDQSDKYIVSLKVIFPDQLAKLKEIFGEATEVPIEMTNGCFGTASQWVKKTPEGVEIPTQLPMKGEKILANIDWVDNTEKTAKLLRVTNIQLKPAAQAEAFDFDKFFGLEEETAETSSKEVVQKA
jgi:hypothetical protein